MARWVSKSYEFYRLALLGDAENIGLREAARGFSSREGVNLRKLTDKQKKVIESAFSELSEVTAQYRYVYKPKNQSKKEKQRLKQAQQISQSGTKTDWKVAFIPVTPEFDKKGKLKKPRLYFGKEGVRVRQSGFSRVEIPLNQVNLAKNAAKEIREKVKHEAPGAQRFTIQAGANEMPVLGDLPELINRVRYLMQRYNGSSPLPRSSGNYRDDPRLHDYRLWLNGVVAYDIDKPSQDEIRKANEGFRDANKELQRKRRNARARLRELEKRNKRRKS